MNDPSCESDVVHVDLKSIPFMDGKEGTANNSKKTASEVTETEKKIVKKVPLSEKQNKRTPSLKDNSNQISQSIRSIPYKSSTKSKISSASSARVPMKKDPPVRRPNTTQAVKARTDSGMKNTKPNAATEGSQRNGDLDKAKLVRQQQSAKPGSPSPSSKPGTPSPSSKPGTPLPSSKPGTPSTSSKEKPSVDGSKSRVGLSNNSNKASGTQPGRPLKEKIVNGTTNKLLSNSRSPLNTNNSKTNMAKKPLYQKNEKQLKSKTTPTTNQNKVPNKDVTISSDEKFSKMSLEVEPVPKVASGVPALPFNRQNSHGDQLITFKDSLNPRTDFDQLTRLLGDSLDEKEKGCLKDLKQYLVKKEEAWLLDHQLLNFIGGLLEHRSLNPEIRVKLLRLLAAGALRDDFWSFLQMDRKGRHLMKYPNDFEDLSVEEQKAVAVFLCNNFSSSKGSDWLLYGSPWSLGDGGGETCNAKITSKVAAYSLVSYTPSLQDFGSAMIYNIALKEAKALQVPLDKCTEEDLPTIHLDYGSVSDTQIMTNSTGTTDTKFVTLKVYNDIAVEMVMAVLKFIKKTKNPEEEIMYRCVKSLLKFSLILKQDLLSCVAMVHVDLDELVPNRSERIDGVWKQLRQQLVNNGGSGSI